MGRFASIVFPLAAALLSGCASYYTRHMSEHFKDAKIEKKTFAILPVMDISYQPPSSCFGPGSGSGEMYRKPWLETVEKDLRAQFKTHSFRTYAPEELEALRVDVPSLYSAASDEINTMGVSLLESSPNGPPKVTYEAARAGGKVGRFLRALHDSDKVDYVIVLVEPKMVGETHTSYNAGTGGMSSYTVYTSDMRFGVWSAESGELAYSSGSIGSSSGFCFFLSPQQGSINGSSNDMALQLKVLIARLLEKESQRPVELGWSGAVPR